MQENIYDFVVLGASGYQGQIVSKDLLKKGYRVLLADLYPEQVRYLIKKFSKAKAERIDLEDNINTIIKFIKKNRPSVVVNCAEGDYDLKVYKICLRVGVSVIDLGSDPDITQKQLHLNGKFKRKQITGITGCGAAPGIVNILLKSAAYYFDTVDTVHAGFAWNSNIKKFIVPFSIGTIAHELMDKAKILDNGRWITIEPIKNIKKRIINGIGEQKLFLAAQHPEAYTFSKYLKKKKINNIRFYAGFPVHSARAIMLLVESGLCSDDVVMVDGQKIYPSDIATQVLKRIPRPRGYKEREVLWVTLFGTRLGKKKRVTVKCIVSTIKGWEKAGCNIDTGIPASIIAEMIYNGTISAKGSFEPCKVVPSDLFFRSLKKYHMEIFQNTKRVN